MQPEARIGRKAQRQEHVFLILETETKLEILEWSDFRELGGGSGEMEAGERKETCPSQPVSSRVRSQNF